MILGPFWSEIGYTVDFDHFGLKNRIRFVHSEKESGLVLKRS